MFTFYQIFYSFPNYSVVLYFENFFFNWCSEDGVKFGLKPTCYK